jgi:hypothetical protein
MGKQDKNRKGKAISNPKKHKQIAAAAVKSTKETLPVKPAGKMLFQIVN